MIILITLLELGQPRSVNSYEFFAETYTSGLDPIVADLVSMMPLTPMSVDPLITAIVNYIQPLYFSGSPPLDQQQQLHAMVGNIFNCYANSNNPFEVGYSDKQLLFIRQTLNRINTSPISTFNAVNLLYSLQDGLTRSDLTAEEQAPILMALAIAFQTYGYFRNQIVTPSSDWSNFLDPIQSVNFVNLRNWVNVAFVGALIGATQSVPVVPINAAQGTGIAYNLVTTLAGAFSTVFGDVVYGWATRMHVPQIISEVNLSTDILVSNSQQPLAINKRVLGKTSVFSGPQTLCW